MLRLRWFIIGAILFASTSATAVFIGGELESALLEVETSDPVTGVEEGRIYWNSTSMEARIYDGTVWRFLTGAGAIPDPLLLSAGVAANPSYSFSGQSDSGMYDSGVDQVGFATAGVRSATIGPTALVHYNPAGGSSVIAQATEGTGRLRARSLAATPGDFDSVLEFGDTADTNVGRILYDHAADSMEFWRGAMNEMTLVNNQIKMVSNGNAAIPAFGFNSATGSGMWRAADQLNFSIEGVQVVEIEDTATTRLNVLNAVGPTVIRAQATTGGDAYVQAITDGTGANDSHLYLGDTTDTGIGRITYDHSLNEMQLHANNVEVLRLGGFTQSFFKIIAPVGSVSAPTFTFASNLTDGLYNAVGNPAITNDGVQRFLFGATINRSLQQMQSIDGDNTAPGYSFTSDTNTGLYRAASAIQLAYNGTQVFSGDTTNGVKLLFVGQWGNPVCSRFASGTTEISDCSSSIRYKKNVVDITDSESEKIYDLRPVKFDMKSTGETNFGFIAEEVIEVLPELTYYKTTKDGVLTDDNGDPLVEGVHYKNMTALLLAEMKKLKARIEILEAN